MGNYLIPANSKKSMLIFGFFTVKDLIVFGTGATVTIIWLLVSGTNEITQRLIQCLPLLVTLFLVMPVPNYHNVMTLIGNIIKFYTNRRRYIWRGWCAKYEFSRDTEK